MTRASVAFVPCAPLLVPQVAGGSAELDADLRAASRAAVQRLIDGEPAEIVVVAPTATKGMWPTAATWDFAGFGVPRADLDGVERLPWSLGIGAWLLDECGWARDRKYVGVSASDTDNAAIPADSAILALGDGTACRTEKAPGHLDPRAEAFDTAIADCLRRGDAEALASLNPELARDLLCAGLPVWRWLARQLAGRTVASATLDAAEAPHGVAYFVAEWVLD